MPVFSRMTNQNGSALVLVLFTLLVTSILGTTIVTVSLGEVKQTVASDRDMKAYYLARSAADATMKWIEDNLADIRAMPVRTEEELAAYQDAVTQFELVVPSREDEHRQGNVSGIDGIEGVDIWRESGQIYVKATATVNGFSSSARVRLDQAPAATDFLEVTENTAIYPPAPNPGPFENAIYATGDLDLRGGANLRISGGDVRYEGNTYGSGNWSLDEGYYFGPSEEEKEFSWPPPADLDPKRWPPDNSLNLSHAGKYGTVTLSGNANLDTQGQDVNIYIDHLIIGKKTALTVTGSGRLFLFIDNITYGGNNANLSIYSSVTPNVYLIFGNDYGFDVRGGDMLQSYLYAPDHPLTFKGNPTIYGAIISGDLQFFGSVSLTYVPPASDPALPIREETEGETTITRTIDYTRIGGIGTNGRQWLKP